MDSSIASIVDLKTTNKILVPKMIFIVPYRNREQHKTFFSKYMEFIMEDVSKDDYEIYFSHQCDGRNFNRGGMKNIGFLAMKEKYPEHYKNITFIFNDVDTLPYTKNLLPYETTTGVIKHFYGYSFCLGGIFSIKGGDFEKTNGFPNFWGWGREDNTMQDRVVKCGFKIDRTTFFKIGDKNILQFVDGFVKLINKTEISSSLNKSTVDGLSTIRNLQYTVKSDFINVNTFDTLIDPNSLTYNTHDSRKGNKIIMHGDRFNMFDFIKRKK